MVAAICLASLSAAGSLPGGATSLVESHGDWQLNCVDEASSIVCAISQTQVDPESRQQIIAVEMRADGESGLTGALVLPFGLALSKGIAVGIDDQEANAVLGFTTCLPVGCIVPLGFDASAIDALADANELKITAVTNDTGDLVTLSVSLQGFTGAFVRMQDILSEGS
jgi:invasion protein IalB